jgi:integrase
MPKRSDDNEDDNLQILRVDKEAGIDEIAGLLNGLDGHELRDAAEVTLYTGMRAGELLALPWKNVDLDEGMIKVLVALDQDSVHGVRVKRTKSKAGLRDISLPKRVVELLQARRLRQMQERMAAGLGKMTEDALAFPGPDGGYQKPDRFAGYWYHLVRRRKLPIVTWHALRHTHTSMLIASKTVDIVTISKRLGHKSPDITLKIYAHLFRTNDRDAADAIDRMLTA